MATDMATTSERAQIKSDIALLKEAGCTKIPLPIELVERLLLERRQQR